MIIIRHSTFGMDIPAKLLQLEDRKLGIWKNFITEKENNDRKFGEKKNMKECFYWDF